MKNLKELNETCYLTKIENYNKRICEKKKKEINITKNGNFFFKIDLIFHTLSSQPYL